MDKNRPDISILRAYLSGNITLEDEKTVDQWLSQSPKNINMLETLAGVDQEEIPDFDYLKVKSQLLEQIVSEYEENTQRYSARSANHAVVTTHNGRKLGIWLKAAAVVLVMVTAGLLTTISESEYAQTITFSEITSPVRTVTAHTLPDGSRVELSANSTLKYSSAFTEDRTVHLEGEAFFNVVRDEARPFKVYSGGLSTTVLGTKFNVNNMQAYGKVEVALVEGSVKVDILNNAHMTDAIVLQPDEWVRYSEGEEEMIVQQGVGSKTLWRDGILEFEENSLEEVAIVLGNWYGVEIKIADPEIRDRKIVGSFKNQSLEHVLETLKFISGIEYSMDEINQAGRVDVILTKQLE